MTNAVVDKIAVRVFPTSRGFAKKLRAQMKEQERRARPIEIRVDPELNYTKLRRVERRLERVKANVKVDLDESTAKRTRERIENMAKERQARLKLDLTDLNKARQHLQRLERNNEANIRVALKGATKVNREMNRLRAEFERKLGELKSEFKVDVDLEDARHLNHELDRKLRELEHDHELHLQVALEDVKKARAELDRLAKDRDTTINADVDMLAARLKLRWLTRPRFAKIIPVVEDKAWKNALKALARVSGLRLGKDFAKEFWDFGKNIDKWTPKIAALGGALAGLTALTAHATGATLTFFGQLSKLGGLTMVLPGMLAAAGIGVTTMVLALKDANKYVGDLKDKFTSVRETMSAGFWKAAEKPIRDTVEDLLPRLEQRLGNTARLMGANFAAIATQLKNTLTPRLVDELFTNLDKSLVALQPGLMDFTHALTVMGVHGAKHLVSLNKWISRVGSSFSKWIENAVESGKFDQWVREGARAAGEFGRALRNLGGVFRGVTQAASKAGHAGLTTMADGLGRLNKAIRSTDGAAALTRFFQDARRAADHLYQGIGAVASAVGSISGPIGRVMQSASRTLRSLFEGVGNIIRNSEFTGGLEAMFAGFERGFAPLKKHADSFATVLGNIMRIVGDFAQIAGPTIAAVIDGLAPLVKRLADRFHELLPSLKAFVESTLAPTLKAIGEAASYAWPLIEKLGIALLGLVGAFKAMKLVRGVKALAGDLRGVGSAAGEAAAGLGGRALGDALTGATGKAGKAAGAFGKLGGALKAAGRFAGGAVAGWAVLDTIAQPVNDFADWAVNVKKVRKPLEAHRDVLKQASNAQDVFNKSLKGVVDASNSWDPTILKAVNKEFGSLGQTLKTLGKQPGVLGESVFGTALDATWSQRSAFREELGKIDTALRDLAVSGERVASIRLQEFAREAVNAKVSFSEFKQSMPEVASMLEVLAEKAGLPTGEFILQKLAAGELKVQLDETGQAFLGVKGSLESMAADSRGALDDWASIFGDASSAPQSLVDAVERAKGATSMSLQEQNDYLQSHMGTFARLMENGGAGAREAFERMIAPLDADTQAALERVWQTMRDNAPTADGAARTMLAPVPIAFDEAWNSLPDFDPAEKWDNAGLEAKTSEATMSVEETMTRLAAITQQGGANASTGLSTGMGTMPKVATGIVTTTLGGAMGILNQLPGQTNSAGTQSATRFGAGIAPMAAKGRSAAIQTALDVAGRLAGLASTVYSSGMAVARSFADGISSMVGRAVEAARGLVARVREWFPGSPAKRGPFSGKGWVLYSGMAVGEAFADGLNRSTGTAVDYADRFARRVRTATSVSPAINTEQRVLNRVEHAPVGRMNMRLVVDDKTAFNAHVEGIADGSALRMMEVLA